MVDHERAGLLAAGAAAILYGSAYPATALGLRSFTPLAIAGFACSAALPIVLALAAAGVLPRPDRSVLRLASLIRLLILAMLGGVLFIAAVNVAIGLSGATITGFVAPLYAVAAALFADPLLGERLRRRTVLAFATAIGGTALLVGVRPDGGTALGIVMAAGAAAFFGLYIVLARRWAVAYGIDGTSVTIANLIGRGPVLLAVEWLRAPSTLIPAAPDPVAVLAVIVIAVGSSSTANLLLMASVRRVSAGRTAAALLLTPVASALISAVVLGDRLTAQGAVGAGLVMLGIAGASGLPIRRRPAPVA